MERQPETKDPYDMSPEEARAWVQKDRNERLADDIQAHREYLKKHGGKFPKATLP
jgi:hypothetical protein